MSQPIINAAEARALAEAAASEGHGVPGMVVGQIGGLVRKWATDGARRLSYDISDYQLSGFQVQDIINALQGLGYHATWNVNRDGITVEW